MEKIKLITPFLSKNINPKFGDYLLFQEYEQGSHDGFRQLLIEI